MLVSSILVLLVGILIGLRFKVVILAPASLGVLLCVIGAGVVRADMPLSIGFSAAVAIVCLQVGYLAGIVIPAGGYRLGRVNSGSMPAGERSARRSAIT